ncbi:MAG: hypothetical protein WDN45_14625 [Caulobacteraceae bacterium]
MGVEDHLETRAEGADVHLADRGRNEAISGTWAEVLGFVDAVFADRNAWAGVPAPSGGSGGAPPRHAPGRSGLRGPVAAGARGSRRGARRLGRARWTWRARAAPTAAWPRRSPPRSRRWSGAATRCSTRTAAPGVGPTSATC